MSREHNSPWKRTEKDRAYQRRKAAADARAAVHVYDPATCKPGCASRALRPSTAERLTSDPYPPARSDALSLSAVGREPDPASRIGRQ